MAHEANRALIYLQIEKMNSENGKSLEKCYSASLTRNLNLLMHKKFLIVTEIVVLIQVLGCPDLRWLCTSKNGRWSGPHFHRHNGSDDHICTQWTGLLATQVCDFSTETCWGFMHSDKALEKPNTAIKLRQQQQIGHIDSWIARQSDRTIWGWILRQIGRQTES